jgi:6-phosphogluconolactonase
MMRQLFNAARRFRASDAVRASAMKTRLHLYSLSAGLCIAVASLPCYAAGKDSSELVFMGTHGNTPPVTQPEPVTRATGAAAASQNAEAPMDIPGKHGIYAARLDIETGRLSPLGLAIELQRTTWLLNHPSLPIIYTVAQSAGGLASDADIHTLSIDRQTGGLQSIGKTGAGGRDATNLVIDSRSGTLLSANFGGGNLTTLPVHPDGTLGPVVSEQKDYGSGPNPRQMTPHAHGVAVDPTRKYALVADFGADRIFIYHFDPSTRKLTPGESAPEVLPAGSGPRHLLFSTNGHFVFLDTELNAELRSYRWDPKVGTLQSVQTISPAGNSADKSAAELLQSRDGRFLYLSLRGDQDSIVVYAVDAIHGTLKEIQRVSSLGKAPWSFNIDPTGRWMLVTNEISNLVTEFKVDPNRGKLTATDQSLQIPHPVAVVFYRQ